MMNVLSNQIFARLFAAQVIALLGTGLMTVALGLLAYELAGERAGAVLGTAYAIKMVAYVGFAPLSSALLEHVPRKTVMIVADIVRASVVLCLPFVSQIWHIYALIFVLQAASAAFTPTFQALIPDVLPDEQDYTQGLSLSRLVYDLENLLSPVIAGLLLLVMGFHWLFVGTVFGFLASALLVFFIALPPFKASSKARPFVERVTRGLRIYLATPRLRGLLALNMVAAAGSAFVLVNTVVIVRAGFGGGQGDLALALAAYGAGSMTAAIALPRLLTWAKDRPVMMFAAVGLTAISFIFAAQLLLVGLPSWIGLLAILTLMGLFYSAILTPSGRLLRRSAHPEDRPAIFAAQFALSHCCWLLTYPIAGWAGVGYGLGAAMAVLAVISLISIAFALWIWPGERKSRLFHEHPELRRDHPHLREHATSQKKHGHVYIIDDEHQSWPVSR